MIAEQIKIGDVVQLKSGGAHMIVHQIPANPEYVICKWHDKDHKPHQDNFPAASLKKVEL